MNKLLTLTLSIIFLTACNEQKEISEEPCGCIGPQYYKQEIQLNYQYELSERFCRNNKTYIKSEPIDNLKELKITFRGTGEINITTLLSSDQNTYHHETAQFSISEGGESLLITGENKQEDYRLPKVNDWEATSVLKLEMNQFIGESGSCKEGETLFASFN